LDPVGTALRINNMISTPVVSVITIFLNAAEFVREAVDSVFTQTYSDWELLLVDDGSTDASSQIAKRYAGQHPEKVQYFEHKGHRNRGTGPSRNLGLRHARGKYIAFLDADDVWLPHKLEQQVAILEANPEVAMVYGPPEVWHSWTGNLEDAHRDFVPQKLAVQPDTVVNPPALLPYLLRNECVEPFPSGILCRRTAINRVGGFDDGFRGIFEDQVLFAKLCLDAPVFVSNTCWYKYRRHPRSVCSVIWETGNYPSAWVKFLAWLAAYLWKRRLRDGEVWTILHRELGPYRHPVVYRFLVVVRHLRTGARKVLNLSVMRALRGPLRSRWRRRFRRGRSEGLRAVQEMNQSSEPACAVKKHRLRLSVH
jgi:glycosyltransferase involved in cell wall biosynthesis